MNRRTHPTGLALVELLVLTGAITLLLLILLTSKRSTLDPRMPCGTSLSGIGKAMLVYSSDYRDELPRAGGGQSEWTGRVADWQAGDRKTAYGLGADGTGGQVSISASLYLLVKYMELTPKSFVCRGDKEAKEFKVEDYRFRGTKPVLSGLWDFGPDPARHCSYAYQMLYGGPALTVSAEPEMAIAADRNPWMDEQRAGSFSQFTPEAEPFRGTVKQARLGNAMTHEGEGQNVLFLDTHVQFKKWSYCSLDADNIYTSWDGGDKIRGRPPKLGSRPAGAKDSLLVNDPPAPRK